MRLFPRRRWLRWLLAIVALLIAGATLMLIPALTMVGDLPQGEALERIQQSPNYRAGRFVNPVPMADMSIARSLKEWVKGKKDTVPHQPIDVVDTAKTLAIDPGASPRITWLGHSTSLVELEGIRLLLDPVWAQRASPVSWAGPKRFFEPPLPLEQLPPIDAVLISHDHYDHLDKVTVVALATRGIRFIVPLAVGSRLAGWGIPWSQIQELDWWDETAVGPLRIVATPARHFSGRSLVMADREKTLWAGFAMVGTNHRLYYTGDTGMFPGFKDIGDRLGPFDATLIEIGAYHQLWADYHIGPEQAIEAVQVAQGGVLIPVHWATFDLAMHSWIEPGERLIVAAESSHVPIALPRPGGSIDLAAPPPIQRWWPKASWQTADEHPIVSSGLATM
jgi:L-ascorbate metabolism protein UlaG (beta-lactamase superfamily)